MTALERLERTGSRFASLVEGVRAGQWAAPTPCGEWDVAELVRHVVMGNRIFVGVLAGSPVAPEALYEEYRGHDPGTLAQDAATSAADLVASFRRPGTLERTVTIPVGTVPGAVAAEIRVVEDVVHGWDLATATGQRPGFDEADIESALSFTERARDLVPPDRKPFADPVPADPGDPVLDRLVALLGRHP